MLGYTLFQVPQRVPNVMLAHGPARLEPRSQLNVIFAVVAHGHQ